MTALIKNLIDPYGRSRYMYESVEEAERELFARLEGWRAVGYRIEEKPHEPSRPQYQIRDRNGVLIGSYAIVVTDRATDDSSDATK